MAKKSRGKKYTPNQQEYRKNLTRIKRYIRKYEKLGFEFEFELPEMPARVTQKQLRLIRGINPEFLSDKAYAINYRTGRAITISQYKSYKQEERKTGKNLIQTKPSPQNDPDLAWDIIIENFRSAIRLLPPKTRNLLTSMLDNALRVSDIEDVAKAIEGASNEFKSLFERLAYDSDGAAVEYSSAFLGRLEGVTNDTKAELEEEFFSYMYGE